MRYTTRRLRSVTIVYLIHWVAFAAAVLLYDEHLHQPWAAQV